MLPTIHTHPDNTHNNTEIKITTQKNNPLHGVTLAEMIGALVLHYGWHGLGERIHIRCFVLEPSVASSLKFLRKTAWAREKTESLYLCMLREQRRHSSTQTASTASTKNVLKQNTSSNSSSKTTPTPIDAAN